MEAKYRWDYGEACRIWKVSLKLSGLINHWTCLSYVYFRNIIEMVVIQRRDNLMWAIPGGMVDAGEKATSTLKREFIEEAMNSNKGTSL